MSLKTATPLPPRELLTRKSVFENNTLSSYPGGAGLGGDRVGRILVTVEWVLFVWWGERDVSVVGCSNGFRGGPGDYFFYLRIGFIYFYICICILFSFFIFIIMPV